MVLGRQGWFVVLVLAACSVESAFEWDSIGFSGSDEVGGACALSYGMDEVDFVTIECEQGGACTCLTADGPGETFTDDGFCQQAKRSFEGTQQAQRRLTHDVVDLCGEVGPALE